MTVAASELERVLRSKFPWLVYERVNCRPIAGTRTWSQHSWPGGNGRDIFGPDKKPSPSSQAMLDQAASHLRWHSAHYGIKTILWRVPDHYNHIHVDMWPTGHGTPPCAGGAERYRYSNGRIVRGYFGRVLPEGTFEVDTMIVRPGSKGNYVRPYQQALNNWATVQAVPNWATVTVDGDYGPATTSAVVRYQNAAQLVGVVPEPGALDDLTRDLLDRYMT